MKNDLIYAMTESFEGLSVDNHCVDVNKMVEPGSGSQGEISEMMLNRCACYLIEQKMQSKPQKSRVHIANKKAVRKTTLGQGIRPESLSPAEVAKKVERRPTSAEMKAIKTPMGWMENEQ